MHKNILTVAMVALLATMAASAALTPRNYEGSGTDYTGTNAVGAVGAMIWGMDVNPINNVDNCDVDANAVFDFHASGATDVDPSDGMASNADGTLFRWDYNGSPARAAGLGTGNDAAYTVEVGLNLLGTETEGSRGVFGIALNFGDSTESGRIQLEIGEDSLSWGSAAAVDNTGMNPSIAVASNLGYHTWRVSYDQAAQVLWVFKDGIAIDDGADGFDVIAQSCGNPTGGPFIGDYSSGLAGDWELSYLVLDATGAYSPTASTSVGITYFSADRTDVFPSDNEVALTWDTVNETSLVLEPGSIDVLGTTGLSVFPTADTTYSLIASDGSGSVTNTIDINVITNDPVINSFTADDTNVLAGTTITLSWDIEDATSLSIDQGVGDVTGQTSVDVVVSADTTYTITASNENGDSVDSVVVTEVTTPPVINTFTSNLTNVLAGATVTLSWDVVDSTSVSIDQGVGDVTGSTSIDVVVSADTTYTLTAANAFGSSTETVDITLLDATVLWRRDWEQLAHNTVIDDTNLDGGPVSAVEKGTQDFTVVGGPMRVFNSDDVGGFDLISDTQTGLYTNIIEITDVQYASSTEHNLEFVIGTGASSYRNGSWFVEFGTMVGGVFTPLPGVDSGSATYTFDTSVGGALTTDENFNDDTNPSGWFGYNVGGRSQTLTVDATDAVNGQNVAIRMGISSSNRYAGFTDMMLTSTGAALGDVGTITISNLAGGEVGISWDSLSGQAYDVQTNGNLIVPNWGVLDSVIGTGGNITVTSATAEAELFYKVTSE